MASRQDSRCGDSRNGNSAHEHTEDFKDYLKKLPPAKHTNTFNRGSIPGSTFVKKRLIDGSNFLGEIRDGKPNGYGLIVYPANDPQQRDRFGGELQHGKRVGEGSMTWRQGSQYAGEWVSDKPHGYGGESGVDWSLYLGQWRDDEKHGFGIYTFADGSQYEGGWRDGEQHGRGILFNDGVATQVEYHLGKRIEHSAPLPEAELDALVAGVREAARRAHEVWERTLRVLGEHEHDWQACAFASEPPRRRPPQRLVTAKTQQTARTATAASDARREGVQKGWERMEREGLSTAAWGAWRDRAARRIDHATEQAAAARAHTRQGQSLASDSAAGTGPPAT